VSAASSIAQVRVALPYHLRNLAGVGGDVVLEVARRHALPVAATAGRFPTDPAQRAACFVADGHCNDAGYALMAEAFADAVLREAGR